MTDYGLEHLSEDELLRLMAIVVSSDDPSDIEFGKRCGRELARRKPTSKPMTERRALQVVPPHLCVQTSVHGRLWDPQDMAKELSLLHARNVEGAILLMMRHGFSTESIRLEELTNRHQFDFWSRLTRVCAQ